MQNLSSDTSKSKYCFQCDNGTKLNLDTKDVAIEVRGESCVVSNLMGWHCPVCNEIEYIDNDNADRMWEAIETLGAKAKVRDAAILAHARKRLKLTQNKQQNLLAADTTLSVAMKRGEAVLMRAVINLFKLLDKHPELIKELA